MKKIITILFFLSFSIQAQIPRMSKNLLGKGDLSWLFFDIYEAKLWAKDATSLYKDPLTLELTYKMDFAGKDIAEQTIKELKDLGEKEELLKEWKPKLAVLFPNIKEGDTLSANYHPEKGIEFFLNLKEKVGKIENKEFSKKFLNIWLSKDTRAPKLRRKLLGFRDF